tara:strand:- start:16169 stop:17071 length:903 start_codon:yes stop_codon:yes gene_type:complete
MKVYRYIIFRSLLSVIGVLLIISAIDFSFNFFSQIEDIGENYSYKDAFDFLIASQPYRIRESFYLCAVVGLLAVFIDQNFLRAFNALRQAGLSKIKFSVMVFMPIVILGLLSYEYVVPDLTRHAFDERKAKVSSESTQAPTMIEIEKLESGGYIIISEDLSLSFDSTGNVVIKNEYSDEFSNLNYNANLKYLTFSELWQNSYSSFENFNLKINTEILRRSVNFISYFVIFLIGLQMLLTFNKTLNINRILVYGFGSCLIYRFAESLVADSISVFNLSFLLQAFPLLMIPIYFLIKKRISV